MSVEVRRLAWRCRRGMRELDVLLERFLREDYPDAPPAMRRAFAVLLDLPDPLIADYLLLGARPGGAGAAEATVADRDLADVVARVARRTTVVYW